jgi:hypothetical protein
LAGLGTVEKAFSSGPEVESPLVFVRGRSFVKTPRWLRPSIIRLPEWLPIAGLQNIFSVPAKLADTENWHVFKDRRRRGGTDLFLPGRPLVCEGPVLTI